MVVSICRDCRYEKSDCKGSPGLERTECQYFREKLAINYPKRIEILEKENEALLLRADRLEAELAELKQMYKELNDLYDDVKAENNRLHQWTLNDKKVRHGFELAIETLNKCKER